MLAEDIAKLMTLVPLEEQISKTEGNDRSVALNFIPIIVMFGVWEGEGEGEISYKFTKR